MLNIDRTSWVSPNHSQRTQPIKALLLHTGEGTSQSDLDHLCDPTPAGGPAYRVSAHYYVCRDGTIYQLVDDEREAWHAGEADYAGLRDWNAPSIGIETEHRAGQDWPQVQRDALAALCRHLVQRYAIPKKYVAAHRWVAIPYGRKHDPSDWPDAALISWIDGLYDDVFADAWAAWGNAFPLPEAERAFAIPQAWLARQEELGEARSAELYLDSQTAVRSFQKGVLLWEMQGGKVTVIDRHGLAVS